MGLIEKIGENIKLFVSVSIFLSIVLQTGLYIYLIKLKKFTLKPFTIAFSEKQLD